jgi:hypothetical protein
MDLSYCLERLSHQATAVDRLVHGLPAEQAAWRPDPDSWSVLEVICHLLDEEREDFRAHLDHLLFHAGEPWPPFDPTAWPAERGYNRRELGSSLGNWLQARQESIDWLRGLAEPDWRSSAAVPWGHLAAGDVLASWVAHDLLHTRQLVELLYAYTAGHARPYAVRYAGPW